MLFTITTTHRPATDLGFLLHKNPARPQTKALSFGEAHVVWPEKTEERATCAVLLDVDPVALVRGRSGSPIGGALAQYVNDRPYVASSLMSVAISGLFGTALNGTSKERQALADTPIPLEVVLSVVPSRGGEAMLARLFEPLGYEVASERLPRDEAHPEWGESALYRVRLSTTTRVCDLLRHLYVLIPVLDDHKHYWVGEDEVEKLLAKGRGWLEEHPDKEQIALRYLKRRRGLAQSALDRLAPDRAESDRAERIGSQAGRGEQGLERPLSLNKRRISAVVEELTRLGARSVADVGCGEGKLMAALLKRRQFQKVIGLDVSPWALSRAENRLGSDRAPAAWAPRFELIQGSVTWRDERLDHLDAIVAVEVIEHIELERLPALVQSVFGGSAPTHVLVSTPNVEYNATFSSLKPGQFRHRDHRWEWGRDRFARWVAAVCEDHPYTAQILAIGDEHPEWGAPTQLAVFSKEVRR